MRYPYLRDDPANPVDIEVIDSGLRFLNSGGASELLTWSKIKRVRLLCEAEMNVLREPHQYLRFMCHISIRGRPDVVIVDKSLNGSQLAPLGLYRQFVDEIHRRMLSNAKRKIDLRAGWSWRSVFRAFAWEMFLWSRFPWLEPLIVLGIVFLGRRDAKDAPWLQMYWRNLPARYHPAYIPDRVLPPMEAS